MTKRNEYPRPQFRRESWQPLNGTWEFAFDDEDAGMKRGLWRGKTPLPLRIEVPFSYQYPASGIGDRAVHEIVWYRRTFEIEKEMQERRALLCFNAADYETDVWVNGAHALTHRGGFSPFHADVTELLQSGENIIVVRCKDTLESAVPRGKQSWKEGPFACFYVQNTGIWQSVWLEFFGEDCIDRYSLLSDIDHCTVYGSVETLRGRADELDLSLSFRGQSIARQRTLLTGSRGKFCVPLADEGFDFGELLWTPESPNLVDVDMKLLKNGQIVDEAHTRIGLRKVDIDASGKLCLNHRPLYQRLILDQGYWEESGLTPPSAEALKKDIELSKAMGFNGARKHQKLEDPYFYYYAEELGFLVWCEMPSAYTFCDREVKALTQEWQEIVSYAKNFTSVIAYVPLNESWGTREIRTQNAQQDLARSLYYATRALDETRLISSNDGFEAVSPTDFVGIHDYDVKGAEMAQKYAVLDGLYPQGWALFADGSKYEGQPVLLTEFGGIAMKSDEKGMAWGYNEGASDREEFLSRLSALAGGIRAAGFQGFCYTQLTDVQQEVNGLLTADRTPKAEIEKLKEIFGK